MNEVKIVISKAAYEEAKRRGVAIDEKIKEGKIIVGLKVK